jgi:hypothetical protein
MYSLGLIYINLFNKMLNQYFKQTMDYFGIKGTELSNAFGCGRGYISDIRTGKCNPPVDRFWELIETMDKLAPGAKRHFGNLIAENNTDFFLEDVAANLDPADLIKSMDNEQLSKLMYAIAARLGKQAKRKNSQPLNEDLILAS